MDKIKIRKGDFVASLLLIIFGVYVAAASTQMPMEASYGGVESHWYVAPALFPLFTGGMLIIFGAVLMAVAVKDGGAKALFAAVRGKASFRISRKAVRALTAAFAIGSFIYVFVPRIDFFISISTFLFFLTTVFYPENKLIRRRLCLIFGVETAVFGLTVLLGLWDRIYSIYVYTFDILAIMALATMILTAFLTAKKEAVEKIKIRTTLWICILTPLFLCPLFRYALRVPLPHEGLILDYMNIGFYSLRKVIRGGF